MHKTEVSTDWDGGGGCYFFLLRQDSHFNDWRSPQLAPVCLLLTSSTESQMQKTRTCGAVWGLALLRVSNLLRGRWRPKQRHPGPRRERNVSRLRAKSFSFFGRSLGNSNTCWYVFNLYGIELQTRRSNEHKKRQAYAKTESETRLKTQQQKSSDIKHRKKNDQSIKEHTVLYTTSPKTIYRYSTLKS